MDQAKLEKRLDTSIDAHAFSGVISIRHKDTVLYERAAGYADRSNKIANTLATRFGIASGTKFLTALAIGKLIAAQKLSFSTKVKDCIALHFPRYAPEITSRHLPPLRRVFPTTMMKTKSLTLIPLPSAPPGMPCKAPETTWRCSR